MEAPIKNITRHITAYSEGWYVRMSSLGRHIRKYFADSNYGSKAKSLKAAIAYRNKLAARQRDGRMRDKS